MADTTPTGRYIVVLVFILLGMVAGYAIGNDAETPASVRIGAVTFLGIIGWWVGLWIAESIEKK